MLSAIFALVMLTHISGPPCSYLNDAGEVVGSDIELGRRIAKEMGESLEIVLVEFEEIIPMIRAGKVDMGLPLSENF